MLTKSSKGTVVELEPASAQVRAYFDHSDTQYGRCVLVLDSVGRTENGFTQAFGWLYVNTTGRYGHPEFEGRKSGHAAVQLVSEDIARAFDEAKQLAAVELEARQATEAAAAAANCPAGSVPCRRKWANGDLMSACYVTPDGLEVLDSDLLESHDGFYWIDETRVQAKREEFAEAAARKASREPAAPIEVPDNALEAYRRYGGSAERAWEKEDELAAMLIGRYRDSIETRGLVAPGPERVRELMQPGD